jgi:uncharacterized protein (UPF0332 family)
MNEDIRNSLAIAEDALDDAKFNAQYHRDRVAANRCYYAFYHMTKGLLVSNDIHTKTHTGLNSEFNRIFIKTNLFPPKFGKYLQVLFSMRQTADYEPEQEITKEDIDKALQMVEEFINFVKEKYQITE